MGLEQGLAIGIEKGMEKGMGKMIKAMSERGSSVEQIAELTGLSGTEISAHLSREL